MANAHRPFTDNEYYDMLESYFTNNRNYVQAVRGYRENWQGIRDRLPDRQVFRNLIARVRRPGVLQPAHNDAGRNRERVRGNPVRMEECPTIRELRVRIVNAFNELKREDAMIRRVTQSILRRARLCIRCQGGHFEQFVQ